MRKSNLTVWFLTLFVASWWGGVEPSNADVCFIVGGCDKPSIETKDCNSLGYKEKSCDGVKEIVYDTCVSKGEKFVKCTCNPNYYMLTERPTNEAAYDIEECTKIDGKKLYRATCKSDYKYTLSKITREDGETNSSVCSAGQTPVADGGICTMLYGANANNANKVLYKDCDCDSTYKYKKETPGFSYSGTCTYKYGDNAGETLYTTVTCDTGNSYQAGECKAPLLEDKAYTHSQQKELTCRTCKCPARYKYASNNLTGNFAVDGNQCGDLYDDYKCLNGWTKDTCFNIKGRPKLCETDTNTTYSVKCSKTCSGYNANYTFSSSCGDAENVCVKVTEDTGTLTCYKKEKAVCPTGYILGSCPSGKTCDTTTATNDTSKTCYKEKATCPTEYYVAEGDCKNSSYDGNPNHKAAICVDENKNGAVCYRPKKCKEINSSYHEANIGGVKEITTSRGLWYIETAGDYGYVRCIKKGKGSSSTWYYMYGTSTNSPHTDDNGLIFYWPSNQSKVDLGGNMAGVKLNGPYTNGGSFGYYDHAVSLKDDPECNGNKGNYINGAGETDYDRNCYKAKINNSACSIVQRIADCNATALHALPTKEMLEKIAENITSINEALKKAGGDQFTTTNCYWGVGTNKGDEYTRYKLYYYNGKWQVSDVNENSSGTTCKIRSIYFMKNGLQRYRKGKKTFGQSF